MQPDSSDVLAKPRQSGASDWRSRVIREARVGDVALPAWLADSYATLRAHVMHPEYPCFFGTIAERRGEMFYAFVEDETDRSLAATMATFTRLAAQVEFRRHNIAVFYAPHPAPRSHDAYHDLFWQTLQDLHEVDPDPTADQQPPPEDEAWEFSYNGIQMFVVCACPSFDRRRSRSLGPGMVLLFQPRAVFVDTITNKVIGRQAREQVRERLRKWDAVAPHPDLGFFGDPGNLEWKQYFLSDSNEAAAERCPFLNRRRGRPGGADADARTAADPTGTKPAVSQTGIATDAAAATGSATATPAGTNGAAPAGKQDATHGPARTHEP